MHNIQCEETMGHAIGHQDSKTIFIRKRFGRKKQGFLAYFFFYRSTYVEVSDVMMTPIKKSSVKVG